ncbi:MULTISPECIES: hypothetical protein [unclassified Microcoleus]
MNSRLFYQQSAKLVCRSHLLKNPVCAIANSIKPGLWAIANVRLG